MASKGKTGRARTGRRPAGAAVIAFAALALAAAGCGHVLPLGTASAAVPAPTPLASAIALQPALIQRKAPAGACPAGYTAFPPLGSDYPWSPTVCDRLTGEPVAFTSAVVAVDWQPNLWVLRIIPPAADAAALSASITTADESRHDLAATVAGKTWILPGLQPLRDGQFDIVATSKSQALQFQRILLHRA
jgi:hypothetical protein